MRIEIIVFDGFDPLDVVAPREVFVRAATLDPSYPMPTDVWRSGHLT